MQPYNFRELNFNFVKLLFRILIFRVIIFTSTLCTNKNVYQLISKKYDPINTRLQTDAG